MRYLFLICLIFFLSNILLGCYSWYQSKSFENILNILGLLGCELIVWLIVVFELNVVKVWVDFLNQVNWFLTVEMWRIQAMAGNWKRRNGNGADDIAEAIDQMVDAMQLLVAA